MCFTVVLTSRNFHLCVQTPQCLGYFGCEVDGVVPQGGGPVEFVVALLVEGTLGTNAPELVGVNVDRRGKGFRCIDTS